jgi:voltage-gated potassium channel
MVRDEQPIFLFLLVALLALLLVQPQIVGMPRGEIVMSLLSSLLQIAAILFIAEDRRLRLAAWVFGLPTILAIWAKHGVADESQEFALVAGHVFTSLFLLATAVLILRFVFTHNIRADCVLGAICAYLLIGASVGHLCDVVETLAPGSYRYPESMAGDFATADARSATLMYFSFTSLTTIGFGDIVPNTALTRTMAWIEGATGQLYLAVLVAGLVSTRVSHKLAKDSVATRIRPLSEE